MIFWTVDKTRKEKAQTHKQRRKDKLSVCLAPHETTTGSLGWLDDGGIIEILQEMDRSGSTPLIAAVRARHASTVQLLLNHGAPANAINIENEQPAADAPPTTTTTMARQKSALHYAVELGMESMVQTLVEHGANVMAPTAQGITPLYEAIRSGCDAILALLLQDSPSPSPLGDVVNLLHQDHLLRLLQDRYSTLALHEAVKHGRTSSLEMMTRRILNDQQRRHIFQRDVDYCHSHCRWGVVNYPAVVKRLLDHGLDPNARDPRTRQTSLHLAANRSYGLKIRDPQEGDHHEETLPPPLSVLELLLDHPLTRCDVNAQDYHGQTPLHIAIDTNHDRAIQVLIDHGARDDIEDTRGDTASDVLNW
jgi:ankyrin repeat protein